MKKHVVLGIAMMICTFIFAQEKQDGGKRAHGRSDKMKTELSLTDAQDATIKDIDKKYGDKHALLRKDSTMARSEKMDASKRLREEREKEINTVLTPGQRTKRTALKAEQAEKRKAHMQQASEQHQAKMKKALSLTDEQAVKIQTADKTFREKMQALRKSNTTATNPEKAAVRKLLDEHDTAMKSILTPDQFKKWLDMKADRKKKHSDQQRRRG